MSICMHPIFKVDLPTSDNPEKNIPHRHAQLLRFYSIPDRVKLTTEINHQIIYLEELLTYFTLVFFQFVILLLCKCQPLLGMELYLVTVIIIATIQGHLAMKPNS